MAKFVLTVLNFDGTVDERREYSDEESFGYDYAEFCACGYNGHEYGGVATVQRVRGV